MAKAAQGGEGAREHARLPALRLGKETLLPGGGDA